MGTTQQSFTPQPGDVVQVLDTVSYHGGLIGRVSAVREARGKLRALVAVDIEENRQLDFHPGDLRILSRGQAERYVMTRSSELQRGDIVNCHGMRCLIDQEIGTQDRNGITVYFTEALVLNRGEVPAYRVPLSFTECGIDRWHRWGIQGNDLRRWAVEDSSAGA